MANIVGTDGPNNLSGGSQADLIEGLGGNDVLNGNGGDDELRGGEGDDWLFGGAANDVLEGGDGADRLDGNFGVNTLRGGGGDDELRAVSNTQGEYVDGGSGTDLLIFSAQFHSSGVTFSLADPATPQTVAGATVVNVERINFIGNDTFADHITGGALDDRIIGLWGDDVLDGAGGNDELYGGTGFNTVYGGDGDDFIWQGGNDLLLDGGAGVDLLRFRFGSSGGALDFSDPSVDQHFGSTVIRGIERIQFDGADPADRITGGAYDDNIAGNGGDDVLAGGGGNDVVSGGDGIDELRGGAGDDRLLNYDLSNLLGYSLIDGGEGTDMLELSLSNYSGAVTIDLTDPSGAIRGIEQIWFSGGSGANHVAAGELKDILRGGASGDYFEGRGGDDDIRGFEGDDLIYGGAGNDFLEGGLGADRLYGGEGNDSVRAGSGNSQLDGGAGDDELIGFDGADTLISGEGLDILWGGGGNDVLYFGDDMSAGDQADGGAGRDAVVLQGNYVLTRGETSLVGVESLSLQSGANTKFGDTANNFYDFDITTADGNVAAGQQLIVNAQSLRAGEDFTFDGSAETDGKFLVYGGHGVDDLTGGAGVDVFFFEGTRWGGDDRVDGGAGRDALVISAGSGLTHIEFEADSFTNIESISVNNHYATDPSQSPSYELVLHNGNVAAGGTLIVNGSSLGAGQVVNIDGRGELDGNLMLLGGGGHDVLLGGGGGDLLLGGGGADTLFGGAGADVFRYDSASDSTGGPPDLIADFATGTDRIDLSRIDANSGVAGDQAFAWIGSDAFSGVAGELRTYEADGYRWIAGDTNGDGAADLVIAFSPGTAPLAQGDFLL